MPVPEIVSYRLTSSITIALGPHGAYSLFFLYLKLFFRFFKKNIDLITLFLTIFKNDKLLNREKDLNELYSQF